MNTNRGLIWTAAIGMLTAGMLWAGTDGTNQAACSQRPCQATEGPNGSPHKGRDFGDRFMAGLEKLNLTSEQSGQIASIVKLNKDTMKNAMSQCREAREALIKQTQVGPFDEQSVRAACKKAATADEESAVLRAKINSQIRAVLTEEQRATLDKMRSEERQGPKMQRHRMRDER